MNISIAIEKFDPHVGGAERYCWDLAHFLATRGHDVEIVCMRAKDPEIQSIQIVPIRALNFPQGLRHLSFAVFHAVRTRNMPGSIHFCVGNTFLMDIYQPHGGVHPAWFSRETVRYRKPVRLLMRFLKRLSFKDVVQRGMEWWIYKITKPQVIAISAMVEDDIRNFFRYPQEMIDLIPNGIDLDKFCPENIAFRDEIRQRYGIGPDEFVFLFVAQNPRLKGYEILIDACIDLRDIPFKVLIVGPSNVPMREKADSLGDKVVFAGSVSDIQKVYPSCDCLVHPTYYDSCSLVVLESLASGTPVITTRSCGANMFVKGDMGHVLPSGDAHALSLAMRNTISSPKRIVGSNILKSHSKVFADVEEVMLRKDKIKRS
ncbi:MAG: glycosyltransferase family 4 protein [Desulfomonilia bacterium]|nr:glycosyltransferase family 4 protein [Desulfomonilia bacterium]